MVLGITPNTKFVYSLKDIFGCLFFLQENARNLRGVSAGSDGFDFVNSPTTYANA